jgi:hypothetical protein
MRNKQTSKPAVDTIEEEASSPVASPTSSDERSNESEDQTRVSEVGLAEGGTETPAPTAQEPSDAEKAAALRNFAGSFSPDWNRFVARQILSITDTDQHEREKTAFLGAQMGFHPKDQLEGMLCAQLIGTHNAAMECLRRAAIQGQSLQARQENLNQTNKLSRTFATLVETLNRHRGKGHQKVVVEHVHVHSGAQAIVGVVGDRGGQSKLEGQPHAKQLADASQSAMRREDEERALLPIAGNA